MIIQLLFRGLFLPGLVWVLPIELFLQAMWSIHFDTVAPWKISRVIIS